MANVEKLIHRAKEIYAAHGDSLTKDKVISERLSGYQDRITATNRTMQQLDIATTCSACAEKEAGSCCMQEVEEWYDPILLLINLLMGAELTDFREIPGHCLFVGSNGCKLVARYSLCVNYLCPRLKDLLELSQIQNLMTTAGKELLSGWEAEESIRNWLNAYSKTLPSR